MDKTQAVKQAIESAIKENTGRTENLILAADCKPGKLRNAIQAYAQDCAAEDAVALLDESFLHTGGKGLLFSTQALYADSSQLRYEKRKEDFPLPLRYEELDDVGKAKCRDKIGVFGLRYKSGKTVFVISRHARLLSEILMAVVRELRHEEAGTDSRPAAKPESEHPVDVSPTSELEKKSDSEKKPNTEPEKKPEPVSAMPTPDKKPESVSTAPTPEKEPKPVPAAKAEAPKPAVQNGLSSEKAYAKGMEAYRAERYEEAFLTLEEIHEQDKSFASSHPDMLAALGWMYENGQGTGADPKSAQYRYKQGGKAGSLPCREAFVRLVASDQTPPVKGLRGLTRRKNIQTAWEWAGELAASGSQSAAKYAPVLERLYGEVHRVEQAAEQNRNQANALEAGTAAYQKRDYVSALRQFQAAAKQENAEAQFNCGNMYYNGWGTAADKEEALRWYLKAAEQGHATAQFNCGVMYDNGWGIAEDTAEALCWYLKAAEQGYADAQFNCGRMYYNGEGTATDKEEALRWYLKAAEQGHADAQFNCGVMYDNGWGIAEDTAEALRWYLKAAEQGHATAQFNCGKMYQIGWGTAADNAEALRWYLKAAEQGHADAQFLCGVMYYTGLGTGTDMYKEEALRWHLKAAEQGVARAQFNCGYMYYNGEGTAKDTAEAKRWFQKAAEQGDEYAKEALLEYF